MTAEEILRILSETGALLQGHFELRSKLHSDRYFQCAQLLRFPRLAEQLCRELACRLRERLEREEVAEAVIAPALGGILVGYELARALNAESLFVEKDAQGQLALRRFSIRPEQTFVVAEDVVTRGGRVGETLRIVEQAGGRVVAVAMLIDRSGGAVQFPCPAVSLLEMVPPTWDPGCCPLCARGIPWTHPGS